MRTLLTSSCFLAICFGGGSATWAEQPSSAQDPVKLSPEYYTLKTDNERVRVLDYRLKPGHKEAAHSHPVYVIYFFGPAKLRSTLADGKTTETSVTEGEVLVRGPLTHVVENIGNTELHALLVELKNSGE